MKLRLCAPTTLSRSSTSLSSRPRPPYAQFSLHDALPIYQRMVMDERIAAARALGHFNQRPAAQALVKVLQTEKDVALRDRVQDRKSTRLNSSHLGNSYAVFCFKKKKRDVPCRLCSAVLPG